MEEAFNKTSDLHGLIDQTVDMGNPHMFSALHGLIAKKFRHDDLSLSPVEYLVGKECLHF